MARYQSVTGYWYDFDLHDRCQFYLAAVASFDMAAAAILRKTLAVCRNDQGLVRNFSAGDPPGHQDHKHSMPVFSIRQKNRFKNDIFKLPVIL